MGRETAVIINAIFKKTGPKTIIGIFGCIYLVIIFCNHYFFRTFCFDYGVYNFAFYDYAHLRLSDCPLYFAGNMNFLQDHLSFTLMLFVPLYWLLGWLTGTYTLLYTQVAFVLLGGWYVYRLIELKSSDKTLSILALLQYLFIYGRWTMLDADCNLAIIASSMIPVFIYYFEKRAVLSMILVFIFIMITREDMALWTAFIGLFFLISHRRDKEYRMLSLLVIFSSIAYFVLAFAVIIPSLETGGKKYNLFNYSALGNGPGEAVLFMLSHPVKSISLFFINTSGNPVYDHVKLEFYSVYLLCGGFLLFYRPVYLLLFIPILAKKMLNDMPLRWSTDTYYSVEFVTILPVAVFLIISGVKSKLIRSVLITCVCVGTVFITVYKLQKHKNSSVFWSDYKHAFYKKDFYRSGFNVRELNRRISQIPSQSAVSATGTIVPHIAWRPKVYNFPKVKDAEYIVVFTDRNTFPLNQSQFDSTLNFYQNSDKWSILVDSYPLLILKKERKEVHKQLKQKRTLEYFCDAENITPDGNSLSSASGLVFHNAGVQNNLYAHGGKYSVRLTQETPFGMTAKIEHVVAGERFEISVWRKARNDDAKIIACSSLENSYYNDTYTVEKEDGKGWELLKKRFVVSQNWPNHELKIYLWNSGKDTAYFDDLHIIREVQ